MTEQRLKIDGLHTSANELGSVPQGGLRVAKNIDILAQDVAQPRRGFDKATSTGYSDSADRTDKVFFYQDKLIAHHGTFKSADTLSYEDSGWNSIGSYSAPSDQRLRALEANQNLYFTSSTGVKKMDAYTATPEDAGVPKALNMAISLTGSSGWFQGEDSGGGAENQIVAYRCMWAKNDANGNLITGAPSGRIEVINGLGDTNDRNTSVIVYIPEGITTSHFCQIYRSAVVASPSATPVSPNDEMLLVHEFFPTSGEISSGSTTITDITPEDLRGAALYTNASQEGLAFQNERPPLAKDLATFRDVTFYADTTSKHRYFLNLLSASSMSNDETIIIGGQTYTAKAAEDSSNDYFKLFTAGSASQNIADTAKSLVNIINRNADSDQYATYISGNADKPGQMLIEERGIGGSAFAISAEDPSYWSPTGIPTSGSTELSTNDSFVNGLSWSKPSQPEHVPLVNQVRVGSEDARILRVIGLRDALIIFKEDGIYRLTGYYPNWDVELMDSSAKLIGADTPSILNNEIYCLTDLGICKVSDSVQIISIRINQELLEIVNKNTTLVETTAFGQGYETDKKYYLFLPENSANTYPSFAYVYNIFTGTFVKHHLAGTCSTVYDKTLYYGNGASNFIMKERKNYSYLDYVDFGFTTSISTIDNLTLGIASGSDNIAAGDIIYQSATLFATVQTVDTITSTVTIDRDPGLTVAACDILSAIDTEVKWTAFVAPSPGAIKQYHSCQLFFQEAFNGNATVGFSTDLSPAEETVTLTGQENGAWGIPVWGGTVWGSQSTPRNWIQWVPRSKQRCSQMNITFAHKWGFAPWKLTGVLLLGEPGSEKTRRS